MNLMQSAASVSIIRFMGAVALEAGMGIWAGK